MQAMDRQAERELRRLTWVVERPRRIGLYISLTAGAALPNALRPDASWVKVVLVACVIGAILSAYECARSWLMERRARRPQA